MDLSGSHFEKLAVHRSGYFAHLSFFTWEGPITDKQKFNPALYI